MEEYTLNTVVFVKPDDTKTTQNRLLISTRHSSDGDQRLLLSVLRKMCVVLPENRPSVEEILRDEVVHGVLKDWQKYVDTGVVNTEKRKAGEMSKSFLENHEDVISCLEGY